MDDAGIKSYAEYREYLQENEDEFAQLFDTILINVTGFFRDPPVWEYMVQEVVPRIVESSAGRESIRIWSAGCASGEEAYTVAMLFAEALGEEAYRDRVKIYATDIDDEALSQARLGTYQPKQVDELPAEFRDRYFQSVNGAFTFRNEIRRAVIFGRN